MIESNAAESAPATEPSAEFTPRQVSAATSKLISASIGDMAVVFSRSPAHKHYSLADIECMVLPAVFSGQFFVAEAAHAETGNRAPVAVITWAQVSADTDARLTANAGQSIRLRPDEWTSGETFWLVDAVGDPRAVVASLKTLLDGPFKDRDVKVATADVHGAPCVEMLREIAAKAEMAAGGAG